MQELVLEAHFLLLGCSLEAGVEAWPVATILDGQLSWRLIVHEGGLLRDPLSPP